jgi:ABC-type transport system involved in cytochrome bd biosynthesis fused ATPase/permease subunit
VVAGVILPVGALALGVPVAIACTVPPYLAWRGAAADEAAEQSGALSALVVDAIHGAPDLLAFGAEGIMLERIGAVGARVDALDRRRARADAGATLLTQA